MSSRTFVLSAIAGAVVAFVLGGLIYAVLLADFFTANVTAAGVMKDPPLFWAIGLSELAGATLLTLILLTWARAGDVGRAVKIGAGFGLAASFDIRFLGPGARFLTAFARRGVGPDGGLSHHLPRLVGQSRALELFYTSRVVEADEAERIGLGTLVEDPDAAAWALARELAAGPRATFEWSKRLVQRASRTSLQEHLDLESAAQQSLRVGPDAREAGAATRDQRSPQFS